MRAAQIYQDMSTRPRWQDGKSVTVYRSDQEDMIDDAGHWMKKAAVLQTGSYIGSLAGPQEKRRAAPLFQRGDTTI